MGQYLVLTDTEVRRVFRIIETTRHAERNRLAFTLSIFAGLRVGEIAAPTIADVATQNGEVRWENQTRRASDERIERQDRHSVGAGSKGNRFIPQNAARSSPRSAPYCIAAKRSPLHQRHVVHGVQNNLRDRRHSNLFALWPPNLRDPAECQGRWDADHPEVDRPLPIGMMALYCEVSEEVMRNAVEAVELRAI